MHRLAHVGVDLHSVFHQPASVQHGAVVAAAEGFADGTERVLGELARKVHRDLAREGNVFRSAFAGHIGHPQVKFLDHFFLDDFHGDGVPTFFLQDFAQQILHHIMGEFLAGEMGVGRHTNQRALEAANVSADAIGEEGQYVPGNFHAHALHFVAQNGEAGFHIGRLKVGDQAPLKTTHEAMLEVLDFTGRPVASEHELFVGFVQRVEGVEKFLLNALLAGEELNVINQQHIGLPIFFAELHQLIFLNGGDVFVGKFLGGNIRNLGRLLGADHVLANSVQQVRLAKAGAAVEEERIVRFARLLRHRHRGGVGEAVVVAHHKRFKRVARVKHQVAIGGLARGGLPSLGRFGGRGRGTVAAGGDFEFDVEFAPTGLGEGILQQLKIVILQPHLRELIGHLEGDGRLVEGNRLHRREPQIVGLGVEQGADLLGGFGPDFFDSSLHHFMFRR